MQRLNLGRWMWAVALPSLVGGGGGGAARGGEGSDREICHVEQRVCDFLVRKIPRLPSFFPSVSVSQLVSVSVSVIVSESLAHSLTFPFWQLMWLHSPDTFSSAGHNEKNREVILGVW